MPAVMSRFGRAALCNLQRAWRPQSRAIAAVDPVIARAREMQKIPYDAAKEGEVKAPNYVGWDGEIDGDFKKLSVGAVKGGRPYEKICDSALDLIGFTPMVRMSRFAKFFDVECDLVSKVELFNAGGSVKDRIAKRMVEEAEKSGRIKPGDILIEATSGNTGVGLCLVSAIKGYKQIICLPQKMSGEKVNTMKCLGAEILRTPTEAAWDAEDSHIFLSARLAKDLNGHVLDQYKNAGNPLAHYDGTAEEIAEQCEGKLDYMIMSTGTGGTMTGVAKKLKELIPGVQVVGVDPYGSILAEPAHMNEKSNRTGQEKLTAYQLTKENKIGKDKRCAVLLADSSRNYMSKFMDDGWMEQNGFSMSKINAAVNEKGEYDKLFHV